MAQDKPQSRFDFAQNRLEKLGKAPDICAGKHGGADTSEEAFKRVSPGRRKIAEQILLCLGMANQTCEELEELLDKSKSTVTARISELKAQGLIVDTKVRRRNKSGCSARVYALAPRARRVEP